MSNNNGTPKTLFQAALNALENQDLCDKGNHVNSASLINRHVADFLAQHFNAAMLTAPSKEEEARLEALFKRLTTNEEFPEPDVRDIEEAE